MMELKILGKPVSKEEWKRFWEEMAIRIKLQSIVIGVLRETFGKQEKKK